MDSLEPAAGLVNEQVSVWVLEEMEEQEDLVGGANFGVNLFEIGTEMNERVTY